MIELERIEGEPVPAGVLPAYQAIAAEVGGHGFYRTFGNALGEGVPCDRLYVFDGQGRSRALEAMFAQTEPDKPIVAHATYVGEFLPRDPLQAAIDATQDLGAVVRLIIGPADIVVPSYRKMLERAGVIQRVSFLRKQATGWRCMTVARRSTSGAFTRDELAWIGGYYALAMPLIDRHRQLVGEVVEGRVQRIVELEDRFARRFPALTERERQVCARAAIGMSIEGASLDLGVAASSVLTYRKRAYRRLGVGSANELAALVLR
jgi:DNA-binding CsgD family transcriptional regulator